jgi:hypothetical protein
MFGEATTYAYTHAINLGGDERDVVELCEQYLAILVRELRGLEKASQPIPSALAQDQESGRASAEAD